MAKFRYGFRKVDMDLIRENHKEGETYYQTCKRLERSGELEMTVRKPPARLVSTTKVKKILNGRGMHCSSGVQAELERAIMVILESAIHNARRDKRKTVKAIDVRGDTATLLGR